MDSSGSEKILLITGGSQGIGATTAYIAAKKDYRVVYIIMIIKTLPTKL